VRAEEAGTPTAMDDSVSDIPKGSFPKAAHLLKHSDFQRVYQQGRRHFSGNMTVFYLLPANEAAPGVNGVWTAKSMRAHKEGDVRVGFTVSKALGGSVDRNRMRRRTREAVRHHLHMLQETSIAVDVVINPKRSLLAVEFGLISQEIERAFRVIRKNCEAAEKKSGKQEARRG
jgi:ribonuclease P protein component